MPKLEGKDGKLYIDGRKVLVGFESFSGWYWFGLEKSREQISEINGRAVPDTIWFGLVQGLDEEWGYFSEAEIRSLGKYGAWPIKKCDMPHAGRRR